MIKTSITISEDIYKEAKEVSNNFSLLVSEALREYLKARKINKAKSSFGKWSKRDASSVEIVDSIRKDRVF
ncbi:MAG: type II toxin-antitoxin system CcdA family antitoxin [Thermodesulfovibrionales bacterium]|nr:type II toxin-antitoxin system CcdA family antitoxin [Thermodesulfovibrionales bacterium]